MSIALASPLTGSAQTGLTSPTYTNVLDTTSGDTRRYVVTALGGTQTGVTAHSATRPFSVDFWRPRNVTPARMPDAQGVIRQFPRNVYGVTVRKGVDVAANQPTQVFKTEVRMEVPAGSETYQPAEIRAALSCTFGALSSQSAGIGDTLVNNVL